MRLIKALGIGLGGLLGIIIIIAGALHLIGKSRLDEAQDVAIAELNVSQNDLDLQRGQHLELILKERILSTKAPLVTFLLRI